MRHIDADRGVGDAAPKEQNVFRSHSSAKKKIGLQVCESLHRRSLSSLSFSFVRDCGSEEKDYEKEERERGTIGASGQSSGRIVNHAKPKTCP
jgi:hypothetical protein